MNLGIWYLFKYVYEENTKLSHIHFYKGKKKKAKKHASSRNIRRKKDIDHCYMLVLSEVPLQQFFDYINLEVALVYSRLYIQCFFHEKKKKV